MIKIIKGSYGKKVGKSITRIDAGADPIELSPEQEERLVRIGVAEYVNVAANDTLPADSDADENPDNDQETEQDANTETEGSGVGELPEYSEDMKLDELKKIAESYGVDASSMRAKKDVIAAIEEAKAAPALDAADPVE